MGTAIRMRLRECTSLHPIGVLRDAEFETLGLLSDPQPGMLVFLDEARHLRALSRTPQVACVITTAALAEGIDASVGLAVASDPRRAFFEIHSHLAKQPWYYWPSYDTEIHPEARVDPEAHVAARCVRIGAGSVVHPRAVILDRCEIGENVVVGPGVVLGSAGFQTAHFVDGTTDLLHAGGIRVEDGVLLLANAVIARAIFRQDTTIGRESRIGNLAFVSHNVKIGHRCFIGHGAVVAGNVRIGDEAWIGPGACIADNMRIGERAHVSFGSAVLSDVAPGKRVASGIAIDHRKLMRLFSSLK